MEIRFAVEDDYMHVEKISAQGQHYHVNLRPDIYKDATDQCPALSKEGFIEIVHNETMIVCVDEGRILAYMMFEEKIVTSPLKIKQKILYIDNLAVDDDYKQRGISKMLMAWIKRYASKNQYDKIELQVCDKNHIAKQLYNSEGFTNKSINMEYFLE